LQLQLLAPAVCEAFKRMLCGEVVILEQQQLLRRGEYLLCHFIVFMIYLSIPLHAHA